MYTSSFFLRTTNRPVLTLLPLSRSVLPPLISLAIQFFSYMYICMDPPHSNPTCAQTFHTAATAMAAAATAAAAAACAAAAMAT